MEATADQRSPNGASPCLRPVHTSNGGKTFVAPHPTRVNRVMRVFSLFMALFTPFVTLVLKTNIWKHNLAESGGILILVKDY